MQPKGNPPNRNVVAPDHLVEGKSKKFGGFPPLLYLPIDEVIHSTKQLYQQPINSWPANTDDEASDIEVDTGRIQDYTWSSGEKDKIHFNPQANLKDYQDFAAIVLSAEEGRWNPELVNQNPQAFYESYFQHHHNFQETIYKSRISLSNFYTTLTREKRAKTNRLNARIELEKQLRDALMGVYQTFETAFQTKDPIVVDYLKTRVYLPALDNIVHMFQSSRCRSCYKSQGASKMSFNNRFMTFTNRLKTLSHVDPKVYLQSEESQARLILEKTQLTPTYHPTDKFLLGFTDEEKKVIKDLAPFDRREFDKYIVSFVEFSKISPPTGYLRGQSLPPIIADTLSRDDINRVRELRRQSLLTIGRSILARIAHRNQTLIREFAV